MSADQSELAKVGVNPMFVDTWSNAHTQDGNIHCSTMAIPFCRPAKGAGQ
jgi:hypothetical protein